jgi:DNA-binding NtrC family response regulator
VKRVLIVDDDTQFTDSVLELLRNNGVEASATGSVAAARQELKLGTPDTLFLDLMLPDGSGLEILEEFQDHRPERIAFITGHRGVKSFVREVAGPSVTFLTKPVRAESILAVVSDMPDSEDNGEQQKHFGFLIGESAAMHSVYRQIRQVAPTGSTVFIQGESGTGKELVAKAIHKESGRKGPFLPVNCGGLTAELVASELFGHEKGSFTGATQRHLGHFERAATGTLLLDEITEMPFELQAQFLRVLESGTFLRVGGESEVETNARLVTATNRDPADAVRDGKLREDLFFRLRVFPIALPPLRERLDDIRPLVESFLAELNRIHDTGKTLGDAFVTQLKRHAWPGNVRELRHIVHRSYILADGPAGVLEPPEHFDETFGGGGGAVVGQSIKDVEKQLILSTLEHYGGDKKAAAEILGVSLKTLYNRLNEYAE